MGRPEELLSAVIFGVALVGYLKKGEWRTSPFAHWLVLSLIVGFFSEIAFMPFSFKLFDSMFDAAHLLKQVSYGLVLIGLLVSMKELFKEADSSRHSLLQLNNQLKLENEMRWTAQRYIDTGESRIIGTIRAVDVVRKDGSTYAGELSVCKIELGDRIAFMGMIHDVSEREEYTEKLRETNRELDEFTYVASHDLQEPLRKLVSFCGLLEEDIGEDIPERAQTDIHYITDAAKRMQKLVQNLLEISRTGRAGINLEMISLNECADVALEDLVTTIAESKAVIERDSMPIIYGDKTMITQLYLNLIGNALKFIVEDIPPQIRLTAEEVDGKMVFGVRDNGIGIDKRYAEQIFTPFNRLHARTDFEGTGIGLAICRKTVDRHGGKLWVDSNPGEGAILNLPLNR